MDATGKIKEHSFYCLNDSTYNISFKYVQNF